MWPCFSPSSVLIKPEHATLTLRRMSVKSSSAQFIMCILSLQQDISGQRQNTDDGGVSSYLQHMADKTESFLQESLRHDLQTSAHVVAPFKIFERWDWHSILVARISPSSRLPTDSALSS